MKKQELTPKTIKLEVSPLLANVLSRLLVVETEYQVKWNNQEQGINGKTRTLILMYIEETLKQLEKQGINRYYICDYSKILHDYE